MNQNPHSKDGWLESQISKATADYNANLARENKAQKRRAFADRVLRPLLLLALIAAAAAAYVYREQVYNFLEEKGIVSARKSSEQPNRAGNAVNARKDQPGEGKKGLAGTVNQVRNSLQSVSDEADRRNQIIEETQR